MELVHKGKLPDEKWWKGTCYHCKSVMRAQAKELQFHHDQREGTSAVARCMVCGRSVDFSEE